MVVALPSWLSGVTPCDLVAFLFGLSAILAARAEEFLGPSAELQAPCGAFSFSVPLVETLSSPPCRSAQSPGFWGTRSLPTLEALTRALTSGEFPR